MLVHTKAFLIAAVKYGESDKILTCYTESYGIQSFIAKSVYARKNKTNALLQLLNELEIVYEVKGHYHLRHFKEIRAVQPYREIYINPFKSSICLFLAEVLHSVLKEEEANPDLYEFMSTAFHAFDVKPDVHADFHLWFLLNLSRFLGFYPNWDSRASFFNLNEGYSTESTPADVHLSGSDLQLWQRLMDLDFVHQKENQFNQEERKRLLGQLLLYYQLHLPDFRNPKSLEVLSVVFG